MVKNRLKNWAFCLLLLLTAAASSATAQNSAISKTEKAETAIWQKAHPRVKIVPQATFGRCSPSEQAYLRATSTVLILQGAELRSSDIQRYNSEVARLPAYANMEAYQQAQAQQKAGNRTRGSRPNLSATATPTSTQRDEKELARLRTSDPAAYKAHYAQNPAPIAPITLRRAKYNAMPAAKRAQVDANPSRYRIID